MVASPAAPAGTAPASASVAAATAARMGRRLGGGDRCRCGRRHADDEARATALAVLVLDASVVALGDGADDREPQAAAAPAVPAAADEALEGPVADLGREARPVVLDQDHRVLALAGGADVDRRARRRVAQR